MTPEKKVQNNIIEYLEELIEKGYPVFYERRQAGGFSYKKGIPDLYAVINGIHLEIEVKAINGKLSILQEKFKNKCKKLNILYVCSNSIENFKNFIVLNFKMISL